jgi:hypothetical protein
MHKVVRWDDDDAITYNVLCMRDDVMVLDEVMCR